ncbi:MAG: hypothetical protein IKF17_04930 [Clostridia bacterium]|nr:hypothetical protein [Clostridia bacterium]
MDNKKKFLLLLVFILICVLIYAIIQIYAKYISSAQGSASANVASWDIKVNNLSIKNNTDISNTLAPVFPGTEHIASGIIAPTAEGYFDLNFDFSNTDVSFMYNISLSIDPDSSVQDLVVTGYSIDDGEVISIVDDTQPISDTILYGSNVNTRKIRVYIKWDDDPTTSTMSNADDTLSTKSDNPALYKVNISFTQITDTN